MRKALILGTGGTGARVISRVADYIAVRRKENISNLDYLKYYEIDTASAATNDFSVPKANANYTHLQVDDSKTRDFKSQHEQGKHKWMDNDLCSELGSITDGAAATRMKGKYAFLHHYTTIRKEITARLDKLKKHQLDDDKPKTQIYVVTNLASGTGSGCFVDLGIMVRDIIIQGNYDKNNALLRMTLIVTLPADYSEEDHLRNSQYALEELNYHMMGNPYKVDRVDGQGEISFKGSKIFDYVYIIGKRDTSDKSRDDFEVLISEYIYNDIYSSSADIRDGARDNLKNPEITKIDPVGQRPFYMSFGLSVIEYPSSSILEAASYKCIVQSLKNWIQPSEQTSCSNYEVGYFESDIYNDMKKECDFNDIKLNYSVALAHSIDEAQKNFKRNDYDVTYLEDLVNAFKDAFNSEPVSVGKNKLLQSGYIHQIIKTNNEKLINSLSDAIKEDVLEKLFSGDVGSIDNAIHSVEAIIRKIDNLRGSPIKNSPSKDKKFQEIYISIDKIKNDPLLPGKLFKQSPILKLLNNFSEVFNEYTSDKIDSEISKVLNISATTTEKEKKDKLLYLLKENMEMFKNNIERFKRKMEAWKKESEQKFKESIKTPSVNGYVVNINKIEQLAKATYDDFKNTFPAFDKEFSSFLKDKYKEELKEDQVKDFNYTNKDIFSKVKDIQKGHIKSEDVVDAFLKEQKDKQDKSFDDNDFSFAHSEVNNVYRKSDCFLQIKARDDAFAISSKLEEKLKWVFYPDGKDINSESDARNSNNKFAKILNDIPIIKTDEEWVHKSQSSNSTLAGNVNNKDMVIFLEERGLFPIRFLEILHDPRMINAAKFKSRSNYCINQRYESLIPPNKSVQDEIKLLLIRSIAAEVITLNVTEFTINQAVKQYLTEKERAFSVPTKYRPAIAELLNNENSKHLLGRLFTDHYQGKIYANDDEFFSDYISNLFTLKYEPQKMGLIVNNEEREQIKILINSEIEGDKKKCEKWNSLFRTIEVMTLGGDDYIYNVEFDPNTMAFYCANETADNGKCGLKLGDLNQEEIIRNNVRICPSCGCELKMKRSYAEDIHNADR